VAGSLRVVRRAPRGLRRLESTHGPWERSRREDRGHGGWIRGHKIKEKREKILYLLSPTLSSTGPFRSATEVFEFGLKLGKSERIII